MGAYIGIMRLGVGGATYAEIVTYTIQNTNGRRCFVDEYTLEEYYELGEVVEDPVYVKATEKGMFFKSKGIPFLCEIKNC